MKDMRLKGWDNNRLQMMDIISIQELACRPALNETNVHRITFLFSTGIDDQNGDEIFNGDIVENAIYRFKVEWHKQQAMWWLSPICNISDENEDIIFITLENQKLGNGYYSRKDLKIIGNIYQNPELVSSTVKSVEK